ncbi:MAG: hypothetical protein CVV23_05420 [Ignavibacteriae bacterium HGW-Ignavibacteriae-2]|jgi:lauroyl/myristoyl acyltransferase|nr:MAG: hypothetical protein CVV23_05420 [Ignavibacteriae bacterium HGW-Ignavibacteriae-2]
MNLSDWQNISTVNDVYCALKNTASPFGQQKSKLSKITIARAYCNLIRYYGDKSVCRKIIKESLKFIDRIESDVFMHPKKLVKSSETDLLIELEKLNDNIGKKGHVFLTFHFGVFELVPVLLSLYLDKTIYIVVDTLSVSRQHRIQYYKELIFKEYPSARIEFIVVQDTASILKLINILRNQGIVLIFIDENKSLTNSNTKLRDVPFLNGHRYYLRTSLPYLLKKSDSIAFTLLSTLQETHFNLSIEEIAASKDADIDNKFYNNILKSLLENIKISPHQWTRWYCIDELDELRHAAINDDTKERTDLIAITDHEINEKYVIDIQRMQIVKGH